MTNTNNITIYDVLRRDHDKVKALLNELVTLQDDSERRSELLSEIRDELIPHSRAEEAVFYNSLRSVPVIGEEANHGYREHMAAEGLLRTLQVADKFDADFKSAAKALKEALEHHIKEEEEEMFTMAQSVVSPEESVQMANAFNNLKGKVKQQSFLGTTMDMIANMMPPRFSKSFTENGHKTLFQKDENAA
ncbi:MAG: hemerythrin domain-containing protein [Proteobacteria bacterium]|nr:MAG: hemerythrin domain-containing protein [Pseudomonadota bacterium]